MDTKTNVERIEHMIQDCGCDPVEAMVVLSIALDNAIKKWREKRKGWYIKKEKV